MNCSDEKLIYKLVNLSRSIYHILPFLELSTSRLSWDNKIFIAQRISRSYFKFKTDYFMYCRQYPYGQIETKHFKKMKKGF